MAVILHNENTGETNKTSSVLATSAGILFFSTYKLAKLVSQYSDQFPDFIQNNANHCNDADKQRIMSSLEYNEGNFQFAEDELDRNILKKLAYYTNSSVVHCSGNCVLLSTCLLFNLKNGRNILAAKNSYPLKMGLSNAAAIQIIFGRNLNVSQQFYTIEALELEIIRIFKDEGERFFKIRSDGYAVPLMGESGHTLNAVVVGSGSFIEVVYVDAWKTSNYLFSAQQLQKRYQKGAFSVEYHLGPLNTLTRSNVLVL